MFSKRLDQKRYNLHLMKGKGNSDAPQITPGVDLGTTNQPDPLLNQEFKKDFMKDK